MLPDFKSGRADSCRFTFYVCFNVNRRKTVIYPLRIIHARFMKIYVLCPAKDEKTIHDSFVFIHVYSCSAAGEPS